MSASSVPRPVLFALIGGVLIVAIFFVMQKGKKDDSSSSPSIPAPAAKPSTDKVKPGSEEPAPGSSGAKANSKAPAAAKQAPAPPLGTPGSEPATADDTKLPAAVAKAVRQRKTVVLLFRRKSGFDDRAVARGVEALPRSSRVEVFITGIKDVDRYVSITGKDGVSQTPTLIVMAPNGRKDVQTGYLDAKTIENTVFNAAK